MDNHSNTDVILTQWQTCVEMANAVSQRRDAMNNLFVTLNLAVVAAVSLTWDIKSLMIMAAGVVLCVLWWMFIRNFKELNAEKFRVIVDLEKKLPTRPFEKEWQHLQKNKKYRDGTWLEKALPGAFMCLYVVAIVIIVFAKIINGGTADGV